jgi:hypothetical protein
MPRVKTPFGAVNFPDGTPEPEMQAVLDDMAVQQQQQPQPLSEPQQQGGGFARALQSAFAGVADQPVTSSVPYAVKVPGLSPEMGAQLRGSLTQMRQDDAASQLRQRAQRERELEKEKDRAKDLSLEQQRHKNRQTEMQMKLDQDIALIEREEENGTIQIGSDGVGRRVYKKKNPETGERQYTVETYGDPIAKDPKLITGYDKQGNAVRMQDAAGVNLGRRPVADPSAAARLNAIGNRAKYWSGFGRKDAQGNIVPIEPAEATALATAEYDDTPASEGAFDTNALGTLFPVPRGTQREFTWRDIMAEKARRRQADQFGAKTEAEIDAEVAADFGMTVPEMRDMMRQRTSSGGMPVVQGSAPPAPSATFGPPAPAQQGQRGFYTDDNGQQIPGVMMPDGTFLPD